ncbi:hypothetical protein [Bradyrhizobium sp. USDA 223]|uniref:hypothetical protein n=1 Tax=Bradyrhizobium sp. USDA 223 TaxID=3156306 RepID=UPI003838BD8C
MLTKRWRLNADIAYLPWTDFKGRDYHLLRDETTFSEQYGNGGGGVQIEGLLSYFVTKNISLGVGGRYWAMWTNKDAKGRHCEPGCDRWPPTFAKYSMERWGSSFRPLTSSIKDLTNEAPNFRLLDAVLKFSDDQSSARN